MHHLSTIAALLALPSFILGCAVTGLPIAPDQYVSSQYAAPPKGSLLLLTHLPANEIAYRHGDTEVRQLIQETLISSGYRVAILDPDDYKFALSAELQGLKPTAVSPSRDVLAQAEMRALIEGTGTGVSVEVVATGADGRLLLKNYGGIGLLFSTDRQGIPVPAKAIFTREFIQEAIAIGLAPLQLR